MAPNCWYLTLPNILNPLIKSNNLIDCYFNLENEQKKWEVNFFISILSKQSDRVLEEICKKVTLFSLGAFQKMGK